MRIEHEHKGMIGSAATVLLFLAACNGSSAGLPPAGGDGGAASGDLATSIDLAMSIDGASPDLAPPFPVAPLFIGSGNQSGAPANEACNGMFRDPAAPSLPTLISGRAVDFQDGYPIVGATVSIYADAQSALANQPLASSAPTDMNGNYQISVAAGIERLVRSVSGGSAINSGNSQSIVPTYEFNVLYNDGTAKAVKQSTIVAIPSLVSAVQMAGLGVVIGIAGDCDNAPLGGAHAQVTAPAYDTDQNGDLFYFIAVAGSTLPARTQKFTGGSGSFVAIDVPPGAIAANAFGTITGGGPLVQVGHLDAVSFADGATLLHLTPMSQ
jgi:hypothetical protein